MNTKHYESGGGVVIHNQQMLLLDRPKRNEVRLPKGHIDPGETAEMAALRETTEESGYAELRIVADLGKQVVEFEHKGEHIIRTEYYFLMELTGMQRQNRSLEDEEQFRPLWLPLEQAVAKLTFAAEQAVAQKAVHFIEVSSQ